jgi:hypothetical protein
MVEKIPIELILKGRAQTFARIYRTFVCQTPPGASFVSLSREMLEEIDFKSKTPPPDVFQSWEAWLLRKIEPVSHAKFLAHPLYAQYLHNRINMNGVRTYFFFTLISQRAIIPRLRLALLDQAQTLPEDRLQIVPLWNFLH